MRKLGRFTAEYKEETEEFRYLWLWKVIIPLVLIIGYIVADNIPVCDFSKSEEATIYLNSRGRSNFTEGELFVMALKLDKRNHAHTLKDGTLLIPLTIRFHSTTKRDLLQGL